MEFSPLCLLLLPCITTGGQQRATVSCPRLCTLDLDLLQSPGAVGIALGVGLHSSTYTQIHVPVCSM